MTRPMRYFVLALVVAPALAFVVYKLAKGLGFLDPPWNPEHEQRRTIIAAVYAFLLFLCIFLFGYANAWPRVWAIFGIVNAFALLIFLGLGVSAAFKLWKMRHPAAGAASAASPPPAEVGGDDAGGEPLA